MFKNPSIKNGIILGIVFIIYRHVCYMINPKMVITGVVYYLSNILPIYFMYRAAVGEKKLNEELLSFGEALKSSFLTYVIGLLIAAVYIYILFNHLDPSLNDVLKEVSVEQAESIAKLMGVEGQLEDLPEQLENQNINMGFSMVLMDYLVGLIFPGFIFALVIAAITKKEQAA